MDIVISTHAVFNQLGDVHGPPHTISEYLQQKNHPHVLICHDLNGKQDSIIYQCKDNSRTKKTIRRNLSQNRYLQDFIITNGFIDKNTIYIGVNPVNGFFGVIFHWLRKVDKVIFYSADYATNRFGNPILNMTYRFLNDRSAKRADFVWSVSPRIKEVWRKQGIADKKNILVPNAPLLPRNFKLQKQRQKETLVVISHLTKGVEFFSLFQAIKLLPTKFPRIQLMIIGSGEEETVLKDKVKQLHLEKYILFLGPRLHSEIFSILQTCGIGIALYTLDVSWAYYRDSIKLREYLACGLPVITTPTSALAEEIAEKKAGLLVNGKPESIANAVEEILDKTNYLVFHKNALQLAKKYDITTILDNAFNVIQAK